MMIDSNAGPSIALLTKSKGDRLSCEYWMLGSSIKRDGYLGTVIYTNRIEVRYQRMINGLGELI